MAWLDFVPAGFCKVAFLCYNWEPNWLGWSFLGIGYLVLGGVGVPMVFAGLLQWFQSISSPSKAETRLGRWMDWLMRLFGWAISISLFFMFIFGLILFFTNK